MYPQGKSARLGRGGGHGTSITLPGGYGVSNAPPAAVAVILIGLAALGGSVYFINQIVQPGRVNATLSAKLSESVKHLGEKPAWGPEEIDLNGGKIVLQLYHDRCLSESIVGADGVVIGSALTQDIAKDPDRHASLDLFPVLFAAAPESRCDLFNHGAVSGSRAEGQQGYSVLWHVWLQDGCEFRQWVDQQHGTFGPRTWVLCRH
jgi:hypothetical protein